MTAEELSSRITNYLGNGGFFNPEMMEHEKVRDLLMDCRDWLDMEHAAELKVSRLKQSIHAAHGLLAPLGNQFTPSVLAIREVLSILRGAL